MSQDTYISLLRGINVSGQKIIKMERLRDAFEGLGLEDVQTYVQSGNVVFRSAKAAAPKLSQKIEEMIFGEFGVSVPVIVRSSDELKRAMRRNPFLKEAGIDVKKLYVAFLSDAPEKATLKALDRFTVRSEQYRHSGRELFLYYPESYGGSRLSNNAIEKTLSVVATTRNWNTVCKLCELARSR